MGIEKFDIDELIDFASLYPEFEEKFIKRFDSKESIEVAVKLAINIDAYFESGYDYDGEYFEHYNYNNMIKDLSINFGIYKNEEEFEEDIYDGQTEEELEEEFNDFIEVLEEAFTDFYKELKKKGITNKQIYDDAIQKSGKYRFEFNKVKLAEKYGLMSVLDKYYIDIDKI